ncbi:MAG: hypothetical protein COU81_02390 [Candidatus Portnoybacteria bacterium CG10_big_fil_rev_8_21_14_0_10_36_7]|uniref:Uncharacterized protein n=1 Tax=Candidatus Portnoybacteria bacterium CG10_big_fil_rev_8_21_14_0_10_36_7 TaxID=1974812 RepID=A0A2M8KDY5_9BACT|nr:MAG: hypothetical protein COU81_02390 [Candidatus Portnoybacteria bacterium CG10_big_fil_rev_8_21_14_0_10_36_7]
MAVVEIIITVIVAGSAFGAFKRRESKAKEAIRMQKIINIKRSLEEREEKKSVMRIILLLV